MRTVTFKSVLWGAAKKSGLIPEQGGLDHTAAAQITEAINSAVKLAWEYFDWPELCPYTEETVDVDPDSGARTLSYLDDAGRTRFATVLGVYLCDPRLHERPPRQLVYHLASDGVYLPNSPDTVWVHWRGPHPVYTSDAYDPETGEIPAPGGYAVGDTVYQPLDGRCYELTALPVVSPPPNLDCWREIPVPAILAEALKFGGFAGFRRDEGQEGSAQSIEQIMIEWLDHEVGQIVLQQSQGKQYRRR